MSDIVERLGRKRHTREDWHEPYGTIELPCDADDDGATAHLINPDGPEAAAEMTRLRGLADQAAKVLEPFIGDNWTTLSPGPEAVAAARALYARLRGDA